MLDFDLVHLVRLDDLNVGHGIGQRFPQVCQRNGIAHRQTVDVPKVIRAFPTSVAGDDTVGVIPTDGCGGIAQHRRACGKVSIGCTQIDRHGQLHSRYLQHADDLILEACEAPAADLIAYGIEDEIIGVLEMPTMELTMPVYLGASDGHLAAGAAVLGNTSAPIGGMSTNCVIAGHRGWHGADYFRHIDRLQVGDTVTITNLWETLTYAVVDMEIIQPDQVDKIKIQPGRDLLTLITCHPYASGGRQRLVVYCERRE